MYDQLHSVGVIHRDVEVRHVIGPQEDLSRWRIIDFDDAKEFAGDELVREKFQEEVLSERYSVAVVFRVSAALWALKPGRLLDTGSDSYAASSSSSDGESDVVEEVEAAV